jgi:hypothetical protein
MAKTTEHAYEVIKAMKEEYADGVIKDFEMPPLVNMKTGNTIGFAVVMQVGAKYDYTDELLREWQRRLEADEFSISVKRNQLWLTFKVRDFVPGAEHIAKMSHAIGLDNKQPDKYGLYEAYRNGSYYNEPDPLWDELQLSGYARSERAERDFRYHVTPKGFQFLAEHHKLMIRDAKEYEGRD